MISPLAKKLLVKPSHRVLVLNAPEGYEERLVPLPEGATLHAAADGACDVVLLFAADRAQLERHAAAALATLTPNGILWVAYPKGSSGRQTDLTRDRGWESIWATGRVCVAQVSVDETWSAGRFKDSATVRRSASR